MGGIIQKVFQGRGDKKGKSFWLSRGIPLFLLGLTWFGLFLNFPLRKPLLWFSFSAATAALYTALHFTGKRRAYSIEFLFSLFLLVAGIVQFARLEWLKLAYFPVIVAVAAFYGPETVIPLSLCIPFLNPGALFSKEHVADETTFSLFVVLAAAVSGVLFQRMRKAKEKAVSSLAAIEDSARDITREVAMESLGSEEVTSHYFASILETDEELKELLLTVKQAVFADSASLFTPADNSYVLRCTTGEKDAFIISGRGVISDCLRDRKAVFYGELKEKETMPGYLKDGKITSLFAVPLVDGSTTVGVLVVDSSRYQAFSETERNTVAMFANNVVRILERERIYLQIKRDIFGLKVLKEGSANLVSSLDIELIVNKLCEGAGKIVPSVVCFFVARGKKFELVHHSGGLDEKGKLFDLKGTLMNMAVENKLPFYVSDVKDYRIPVMPFKTGDIQSLMVFPMIYENRLLGMLAMLSDRKGFLDPYQIDMLKVMCNQAATSLANARLHSEIEKMATTDGLTGLLNHRVFQEKLAAELNRLKRFSEEVSLLLTDIDFFKKVNDEHGHPVGDMVLKGVATVIRETIRDIDIPARYGGEEFAVILPGAGRDGAAIIAERLRKAVMEKQFAAEGNAFTVTVSIGLATAPSDAKSKEDLISKADQALYHAKRNGRNQSVSWDSLQ